jgi:hypothetical protein
MLPCYLYQFFRPAGAAPTKPLIKQGKDFKKYKK